MLDVTVCVYKLLVPNMEMHNLLRNNARAKASALLLLTPNECYFYDLFLSFIIQISI